MSESPDPGPDQGVQLPVPWVSMGPSPACQLVWCVASEPGCGCICPGGVFTLQTLPDLPGATQEWSVPAVLSEAKGMVVPKQ